MQSPIRFFSNHVSLAVRIQPGSSQSCLVGVSDDRLKIKLKAQAIEGQANKALVEFLSGYFKLPKSCISIASGELSRNKTVTISGQREKLEKALIGLLNEVPKT